MNTPRVNKDGMVSMPMEEFEALLSTVAERGARAALAEVGLEGSEAAEDIRALRGLLESFNAAKKTAWLTLIKMLTTGFVMLLIAGAAVKWGLFEK